MMPLNQAWIELLDAQMTTTKRGTGIYSKQEASTLKKTVKIIRAVLTPDEKLAFDAVIGFDYTRGY